LELEKRHETSPVCEDVQLNLRLQPGLASRGPLGRFTWAIRHCRALFPSLLLCPVPINLPTPECSCLHRHGLPPMENVAAPCSSFHPTSSRHHATTGEDISSRSEAGHRRPPRASSSTGGRASSRIRRSPRRIRLREGAGLAVAGGDAGRLLLVSCLVPHRVRRAYAPQEYGSKVGGGGVKANRGRVQFQKY
jgi:hypothetical protein